MNKADNDAGNAAIDSLLNYETVKVMCVCFPVRSALPPGRRRESRGVCGCDGLTEPCCPPFAWKPPFLSTTAFFRGVVGTAPSQLIHKQQGRSERFDAERTGSPSSGLTGSRLCPSERLARASPLCSPSLPCTGRCRRPACTELCAEARGGGVGSRCGGDRGPGGRARRWEDAGLMSSACGGVRGGFWAVGRRAGRSYTCACLPSVCFCSILITRTTKRRGTTGFCRRTRPRR